MRWQMWLPRVSRLVWFCFAVCLGVYADFNEIKIDIIDLESAPVQSLPEITLGECTGGLLLLGLPVVEG